MAPPVACTAPVGDWAIDDKTALVFSTEAPIAQRSAREDASAVWVFVPDAFDYAKPEVLFYFHGNNNYVKVGYCDPKEVLVPDCVLSARQGEVESKASGPKYGLNKLPTTPHAPLVLVPEVGRDNPSNHDTKTFPNIDKVLDTAAHYSDWKKQQAWDKANADYKCDPLPPKPPPPCRPSWNSCGARR